MRVLFDTNIVLDVLLEREPFVAEARLLWAANDEGLIVGYITATVLTNIFYIARRLTDLQLAREAVGTCLETFEICPVSLQVLEYAHQMAGTDFEDNVQIASAEIIGLDGIVTRDPAGFRGTSLPVFTPQELLQQINQNNS